MIAQHHWPMWGNERIVSFLKKQRDLYEFMHDQSVRLLNHGLTPTEIAERLQLPPWPSPANGRRAAITAR